MRHYLHLAALVLFSIGFFLFGYAGISEGGYGELPALGLGDPQMAYYLAFACVVLSPVFIYFALRNVELAEWKCMFGGLLLVTMPVALNNAATVSDPFALLLMAGASFAVLMASLVAHVLKNRRIGLALLVVVAGAGIYLGSQNGINYYVGEYSFLLPFSFALLMEGIKERREDKAAPPIIGAAALLFSHPVGAAVLACTSALGLAEMWKEKERPLNLAFMAVFSLCLFYSQADPTRSAVAGLFGFIVFYALAAMYNVRMRMLAQPAAILLMLAAVLTMAANLSTHSYGGARVSIPSQETIEMFGWAEGKGDVGIFAYPNTFRYYAGSEPVLLDPLDGEWAGTVVFSYDTLDVSAGDSINVFAYYARAVANDNVTEIAVYANRQYMLNTVVQGGSVDRVDGAIVGLKRVPFTKIKMLDGGLAYDDARNRVIMVEGIEGSVLAEGLKKPKEHSVPGAFAVRG
ncbi:MAG: hypothetical protein PHQ80_02340 [Candidatus ainarchaeum sp.]|nr:hypothetical protein [Candidatus ainarchaeum sp.]